MRSRYKTFLVALIIGSAYSMPSHSQDCNRECLQQQLNSYLNAVAANKPDSASLAYRFRQTENSRVVATTQGVWDSVTGLGNLQRRYYDPVAGTAGFFGVLDENGKPAIASLRLKIEGEQITEAEWHIGRKNDVGIDGTPGEVVFDVENLIANPPTEGAIPEKERRSRDDLIAIANSYFDGITNSNSHVIKGKPGCSRLENGFPTYGTPLSEEGQIGFEGKWDCRTQGDFGIANVAARRAFVVDVEQQAIMMSVVFIRRPGVDKWRNHFTEVFSIKKGLIESVHAAMFYAEPNQPLPNWPPFDGNFPLSTK
jgi:hypothetical protein